MTYSSAQTPSTVTSSQATLGGPVVIVFGNEKGGTGKSTLAFHFMAMCLQRHFRIISIDGDARQGTFSRYLSNRSEHNQKHKRQLPLPLRHERLWLHELEAAQDILSDIKQQNVDMIIIDTPGSDNALSRHLHSLADVLVSPMNDSYIDLDLLVVLDDSYKDMRLSVYAEMVFDQRKTKARSGGVPMEWIVTRNRLSTLASRNSSNIDEILSALAKRLSFSLASGLTERVVFKQLFPRGLTLLDLEHTDEKISLSHVAAVREVESLSQTILNAYEAARTRKAQGKRGAL